MTNTVQPATEANNRLDARRLWIWPIAILVSFPIGGYLADLLVDGVDSMAAALVGGLITGFVIGASEWFALRRWVSGLWIAATSIRMAAGLTAGAALVNYGTSRADIMIMGAVTGLGVGALQALALARSRVSGALWWGRQPAGVGTVLARDLVRPCEQRSGPIH